MNKSEFVAQLSEKSGQSKKDTESMFSALMNTIQEGLKGGEEITLPGFGKFYTAKSAAREGRNPRTGETLQIAASTQAKFKAGKALKEALN